ncbi:MAG TPA: phosphoribosyltransferase family protein [Gemmatimonadaceae bacterium]|nr:phosphoribosyltransferase family protein [Gemmatimonadaceae bacterium]
MHPKFRDRAEAGRQLAAKLREYEGRDNVIVLALPRGGVPVGAEVARALGAPLDVFLVRKIGLPGHEEFAMGAIASGGVVMINEHVVRTYGVGRDKIEAVVERERDELERRERRYRGGNSLASLRGKTVILVDDGLATGSSMRAAVEAVRGLGPSETIVAVPIAPAETCETLAAVVDRVVCALTPEPFYAVGLWYRDFSQTTDDEVVHILEDVQADTAAQSRTAAAPRGGTGARNPAEVAAAKTRAVRIQGDGVRLDGDLTIPEAASGVVIFAHGSGSSRLSRRNIAVAEALQKRGLATLLLDLLTPEEEAVDARTTHIRFDIPLLASRLAAAAEWASAQPETRGLPTGFFGASTGGGAALIASAARPDRVAAIVSRGGRPDLAGDALPHVTAPTLLIVGENDEVVLQLNEQARAAMRCEVQLSIVPGATHLFEEPGALEEVAELAGDWFSMHLVKR